MPKVTFEYYTGLRADFIKQSWLVGSWDSAGMHSKEWSDLPMEKKLDSEKCPYFTATIELSNAGLGQQFSWGVRSEIADESDKWMIFSEIDDIRSHERNRIFVLDAADQTERYFLTHCKRLGATKTYVDGGAGVRFSVYAPDAKSVEVVFGSIENGYISDDGKGIDLSIPPINLTRSSDGIWSSSASEYPALRDFKKFDHKAYMYKVYLGDGTFKLRTDLHSRCQIGVGGTDPSGKAFNGTYRELDGKVSCSVIIDPDTVTRVFKDPSIPETDLTSTQDFWNNEFISGKPLPKRIKDLVIYELHVGALGYGKQRQGNLSDAIDSNFLDHLTELGVNAVELLPMAEFSGEASWGYGNSHHFAIECSAGGRDQFKHFVRACHQRGLAVIMDVVYNHFAPDSERATWYYDATANEQNFYYWYEGHPADYGAYESEARHNSNVPAGHGGYIDNYSTGYAPRYWDQNVRQHFISSAASLLEDYHVDGFRVDLTNAIHALNVRHADGQSVSAANIFGAKFLREWCRTLKLIKPNVFLIAEDHSGWDKVTAEPDDGGLGFDATWYVNFYHHLIGDTNEGPEYARLLYVAGFGDNQPLSMHAFADALVSSRNKKVVYHESHDEAGNSQGSMRTIATAVNGAPLIGDTRRFAESRVKFVTGMSLLSPGTPMFLMGEEVGAAKPYTYNEFKHNREDILGLKKGEGKHLFKFYKDVIELRNSHRCVRSGDIQVFYINDANRVICFSRFVTNEKLVVCASLSNQSFDNYEIPNSIFGSSQWREIFNSDSATYGGSNFGNYGAVYPRSETINFRLPACGFIILKQED